MQKIKKSENISIEFKYRGNEHFKKKNFQEAIILYNKGLCNAETKSQLNLLYANRSAVYFEVKRFKECLENIELAKKYGYPKEKLGKLNAREVKCKEMIDTYKKENIKNEDEEAAKNFFQLSYKSHPTIPFIIDGIECKRSKEFGRYLITTRDLKSGDIIAIEDPYVKIIDRESQMRFERCALCLKHNNLNLIPCDKCSQGNL